MVNSMFSCKVQERDLLLISDVLRYALMLLFSLQIHKSVQSSDSQNVLNFFQSTTSGIIVTGLIVSNSLYLLFKKKNLE